VNLTRNHNTKHLFNVQEIKIQALQPHKPQFQHVFNNNQNNNNNNLKALFSTTKHVLINLKSNKIKILSFNWFSPFSSFLNGSLSFLGLEGLSRFRRP
jgi:hypothetical protein